MRRCAARIAIPSAAATLLFLMLLPLARPALPWTLRGLFHAAEWLGAIPESAPLRYQFAGRTFCEPPAAVDAALHGAALLLAGLPALLGALLLHDRLLAGRRGPSLRRRDRRRVRIAIALAAAWALLALAGSGIGAWSQARILEWGETAGGSVFRSGPAFIGLNGPFLGDAFVDRFLNLLWRAAPTAAPLLAAFAVALLLGELLGRRALRFRNGCSGCGYDLAGNVTGICPECGRAIADESAGAVSPRSPAE